MTKQALPACSMAFSHFLHMPVPCTGWESYACGSTGVCREPSRVGEAYAWTHNQPTQVVWQAIRPDGRGAVDGGLTFGLHFSKKKAGDAPPLPPGDGHRLRLFPDLWRPAADQFPGRLGPL